MDTDHQQFENDQQTVDVAPLGKISEDAHKWSCFLTWNTNWVATLGTQRSFAFYARWCSAVKEFALRFGQNT